MVGPKGRQYLRNIRFGAEVVISFGAWLGGFELLKYFLVSTDARSVAAQIYVVVTALGVLAAFFWREWRTRGRERYASIAPSLHSLHHALRDLITYIEHNHPAESAKESDRHHFSENCRARFTFILSHLKAIFESATGEIFRASIKAIYPFEDEYYYYTVARDQVSAQASLERDNRRVEQNLDPLNRNKQFSEMFDDRNDTWDYICNDLVRDTSFTSTSFDAYDPTWSTTGAARGGFFARAKAWPLPYRSTIASAIRQGPIEFGSLSSPRTPFVPGFLTIDCATPGVLNSMDRQIMFAVGDSLYHALTMFLEIQNQGKGS
jgi:hypothetical protein